MQDRDTRYYRAYFLLHGTFGLITLLFLLLGLSALVQGISELPGGLPTKLTTAMFAFAMCVHFGIARGAWRREAWIFEQSTFIAFVMLLTLPFGVLMAGLTLAIHWLHDRRTAR